LGDAVGACRTFDELDFCLEDFDADELVDFKDMGDGSDDI
jgi:hypothetical protein